MAKEYDALTAQSEKNNAKNKIMSWHLNLYPAPPQRAMEIFSDESKITVVLQDYSNGVGDQSTMVRFNLTVKEFLVIRDSVNSRAEDTSFAKIFAKESARKKDGPFKGLFPVKRLSLKYQEEYQGRKKDYPWTLIIENGYSGAVMHENGSSSIDKNTYKSDGRAFINVSMQDMSATVENLSRNIEVVRTFFGFCLMFTYFSKVEEKDKNTQYGGKYTVVMKVGKVLGNLVSMVYSMYKKLGPAGAGVTAIGTSDDTVTQRAGEESTGSTNAETAAPNATAPGEYDYPLAKDSTPLPGNAVIRRIKIVDKELYPTDEDMKFAICKIEGNGERDFDIVFDNLSKTLIEAAGKDVSVNVVLYVKDKQTHAYNLAFRGKGHFVSDFTDLSDGSSAARVMFDNGHELPVYFRGESIPDEIFAAMNNGGDIEFSFYQRAGSDGKAQAWFFSM